jgi:hypothetical protein
VSDLTLIVQGDGSVWIEAESLISYFRDAEAKGKMMASAQFSDSPVAYAASVATTDVMRQIGDSLVLTCMQARETMAERRASR